MSYPSKGLPNEKVMDVAILLSIVTRRLFVEPFSIMWEVVDWFVDVPVYLHSVGRVTVDEITPYLVQWYPFLDADVSKVDGDNWEQFVADFKAKHGVELLVAPIPKDDHTEINHFDELIGMGVDPDKIIEINLPDGDEDISPYGKLPSC